jgi:hypothetical protein
MLAAMPEQAAMLTAMPEPASIPALRRTADPLEGGRES